MINEAHSVPVIFIIFNRPDTTRQVFDKIREARPRKLLVIADGPRAERPGEAEKCAATRAIIDEVDWDCEVERNFSETNLGCRLRISSGITWAFERIDKAIILEDDCLPSGSFFPYSSELLDRYESDERVMMISGNNRLFGRAESADSYYFSRYPHYWGWATWRRAWAKYDVHMTQWPEIRDRKLFDQYLPNMVGRYYWESTFQHVFDGNINTWAYQWVFSIWANSGLCAVPARNLIRNIGFHAEATNTTRHSVYSSLASLDAEELDFPLNHPATFLASSDKDRLEISLWAARSKGLLYALNRYAAMMKMLIRRARGRGQWPDPGLLVRGGW
ncbi:methyltransferase type 11 [Mycobacterium paraseoulense]|uniref:methyltransferase type 11 n=1 Tax=Mycobacterium paraseoulense TaxID=590652 RepID=UPI00138C23E2|nr:methyltransferase type 11 [Mycobacterium paraseoulense]BBZ69186.1 hemolytic protein HlpA [Mycobacterium paraseoulense]